NDSFDVVFAFTVLQNLPKPLIALKELGRVVKTEGPVVVTGLKKVFSSGCLRKMLQDSGLNPFLFIEADSLMCYVVVSIKCSK
ncbi:MAG TPA: methyltransferase domain-containing protein, partial [Candidatus Bathyarchaeia archaeon]